MTLFVWTCCSSLKGFLKVFFLLKQCGCRITWLMTSIFFFLWTILLLDDPQKFSYWSDVAFYICNYDIVTKAPGNKHHKKKTLHSFPRRSTCHVPSFNSSHGAVLEIEVQHFSSFPTWLPHHVAYYVIIIIKTFCMCSRTYGENFVSIRQAVPEKRE